MTPSPRIIAFIKSFEAFRSKAYLPTPNDVWTIGFGSTGPDVRPGMVWTPEQADARFERDLADFAAGVSFLIKGGAPTSQNQFDALCSLAYNVGLDIDADNVAEGLGDSTLLRLHRAGLYEEAAMQFARWSKQRGKTLAGLVRRRSGEAAIYSAPDKPDAAADMRGLY